MELSRKKNTARQSAVRHRSSNRREGSYGSWKLRGNFLKSAIGRFGGTESTRGAEQRQNPEKKKDARNARVRQGKSNKRRPHSRRNPYPTGGCPGAQTAKPRGIDFGSIEIEEHGIRADEKKA